MAKFNSNGTMQGFLDELKGKLNHASRVDVGIPTGATESDGQMSALVAISNEFGTEKIPARPFFRPMIASGVKHWGNDLGSALARYKMDSELALKYMGQQMEDELREAIQAPEIAFVALAESTIKRKGNDTPLIDKSDMIDSITSIVEI